MRGERDSWAVRFCYEQSKRNQYAVYPKQTLVLNIGEDGTGTHCQDSGKQVDFSRLCGERKVEFINIEPNKKVLRDFKLQYRVTFLEALDWLKRRILRRNERRKH